MAPKLSVFSVIRLDRLTQGKPWAKLSCPFGAGPSGRMTGAKHIFSRCLDRKSHRPDRG
jgi:hypothetical protein